MQPLSMREQYYRALTNLRDLYVTVCDGTASVVVEQVYLPRVLWQEGTNKSGREDMVKLCIDLWSKVETERVLLIEGLAGVGKTTLTKYLVQQRLRQQHPTLPIWVPFWNFVGSGRSLRDYLDREYVAWLGLTDRNLSHNGSGELSLGHWLYDQWRKNQAVLILDGLDEVASPAERTKALEELECMGTASTRPTTILTSRPLPQALPLSVVKVELQELGQGDQVNIVRGYGQTLELTEVQLKSFLKGVGLDNEDEQQPVDGCWSGPSRTRLTRPGQLLQLLTIYASNGKILETDTEVTTHLLEDRLRTTGQSHQSVTLVDPVKKRQVLEAVALHLLACHQGGDPLTTPQLQALVEQVLQEHAAAGLPLFSLTHARALLNEFIQNSGLFTRLCFDPERYQVGSVIFLHHLAGSALANRQIITALNLTETQVLDFLDKKVWDPEWHPVLKSYVRQVENPFPLLERLTDKTQDDLARHRLGIAGRCLCEVKPELRARLEYQTLSMQIPTEGFEVWRVNAEQGREELVKRSLWGAWVETEVGQAKLRGLFRDQNKDLCAKAVTTMCTAGVALAAESQRALQAWFENSKEDRGLRRNVVEAMGTMGLVVVPSIQAVLLAWLEDPNENQEVRATAVGALGNVGPGMSEPIQAALLARLEDPNENQKVRAAAVGALGNLGSGMSGSIQAALLAPLEDSDPEVRAAVFRTLEALGQGMSEVIQAALVVQLESPSGWVRDKAVQALGHLGRGMTPVIQAALFARLEELGREAPEAVVEALGKLGPGMSEPIQQAFAGRLEDSDEMVRWSAAKALKSLGPGMSDSIQTALLARLGDPSKWVRVAAVEALGNLGHEMSEPIQEALLARLEDSGWEVRTAVFQVLGNLGSGMTPVIQAALLVLLGNPDEGGVRWMAAKALKSLGPGMPDSIKLALLARLEDAVLGVQEAAIEALGNLGQGMSEPIQVALLALLEDSSWRVRWLGVKALGNLGPEMPDSVQAALFASLEDQDELVRNAALQALSRVQQQGRRFMLDGAGLCFGRRVSDLSATEVFSDGCGGGRSREMRKPSTAGVVTVLASRPGQCGPSDASDGSEDDSPLRVVRSYWQSLRAVGSAVLRNLIRRASR